ncbi:hypothetical protein C9I49_25980 [Pseudomonas prosekii]|uniref:Uncharacterized protein n=1 Tax=Pseudomonas prosekii TaxID=1148509 RepID=A0A2U2D194_9PSED|nr:hypothetical protein C9I49_25980 [Pseudomonas prosekii]
MWRGGLPPLEREAVPAMESAAHSNGGKPPRHKSHSTHESHSTHKSVVDQRFCSHPRNPPFLTGTGAVINANRLFC